MSLKTFGIVVAVLAVLILGYVGVLLARQWEPVTVGDYKVLRNRFTGKVQVEHNGRFEESFTTDPYANILTEDDLKRVKLSDFAWESRGLLCGKAQVGGDKPLQGRLAVQIIILGADGKRRMVESERVVRGNVNWPAGATIPFVLNTALGPPKPSEKETYRVFLIPVL